MFRCHAFLAPLLPLTQPTRQANLLFVILLDNMSSGLTRISIRKRLLDTHLEDEEGPCRCLRVDLCRSWYPIESQHIETESYSLDKTGERLHYDQLLHVPLPLLKHQVYT